MKPLSIHIPTPCHEDWQQMTPVEKGRFCQSCAKQVVDFSLMTDQEILNYLSKASGNTCGRFAQDQLKRPLIPVKQGKKKAWWVAAMLPLLMLFEKAGAQKKDAKPTKQVVIPLNDAVSGFISDWDEEFGPQTDRTKITVSKQKGNTNFDINGQVISTFTKQPVAFASVIFEKKGPGTTTDVNGNFHLHGSTNQDKFTLFVESVGYKEKEVHVTLKDTESVAEVMPNIIKGHIVDDENGDAIPFASVMIKNSKTGVAADARGNFNIQLNADSLNQVLMISAVGYETNEIILSRNNSTSAINLNNIRLKQMHGTLGIVVTVVHKKNKHKPSVDTIPAFVAKIFNADTFKTFPNPAPRGSNITVDVKNEGAYSIQLFDNNGKLVAIKDFEALKNATQTMLGIPSSLEAGMYYIRLMDNKKKKQYTDKIVVM